MPLTAKCKRRTRSGAATARIVAAAIAVLTACFASEPVAAQGTAGVDHHQAYDDAIREALALFGARKFSEAKALFQRAHELRPSARTFRALGFAEYELGHYAAALELLSAARSDSRDPLTPEQMQEIDPIVLYANARVGRFVIELQPATATLTVDGQLVELPQSRTLTLDRGPHTLEVSADKYRSEQRLLDVTGAERQSLGFALNAEPGDVSSMAPATQPTAASALASAEASQPAPREWQKTWGWVSLGGATLTLAGSIVAWRLAEVAAARWNDDGRCLQAGRTREQNCASDRDAAGTGRTWTIVGLTATGVLAATAALLLWPRAAEKTNSGSTERRAGLAAGPGELGVACVVQF